MLVGQRDKAAIQRVDIGLEGAGCLTLGQFPANTQVGAQLPAVGVAVEGGAVAIDEKIF